MKNLFTAALLLFSFVLTTSCSDDDDGVYISTSGEGSLVVDNYPPDYLYRMVLFSDDETQELYLLGNSAHVDGDANFAGRGAVIKLTMPNTESDETLQAQSFTIDNDTYQVTYSTYVNFSHTASNNKYLTIDSGTAIIRRSNQFYDIKILGIDQEDDNVIIAFRGYIYRWFYSSDDDEAAALSRTLEN